MFLSPTTITGSWIVNSNEVNLVFAEKVKCIFHKNLIQNVELLRRVRKESMFLRPLTGNGIEYHPGKASAESLHLTIFAVF